MGCRRSGETSPFVASLFQQHWCSHLRCWLLRQRTSCKGSKWIQSKLLYFDRVQYIIVCYFHCLMSFSFFLSSCDSTLSRTHWWGTASFLYLQINRIWWVVVHFSSSWNWFSKFSKLIDWFFHVVQPRALAPAEIVSALGLQQMKNRKWHVQGAIATRGEGLYEGLDWLALTLKQLNRGQPTTSWIIIE